jgi:hypothetical protein
VRFDLTTGEHERIGKLPLRPDQLVLSPDGSFLAATSNEYYNEYLMLVTLEDGSVLYRELPLGIEGEIIWLDNEHLAISPGGFEALDDRVWILDLSLKKTSGFKGWYPRDSILKDGELWGIGWGLLERATLPEGNIVEVRDFWSQELVTLEAVPDVIYVDTSS